MIIKSEIDQIRPVPDGPPPPYTVIEFEAVEDLQHPATAASSDQSQFCRSPSDGAKVRFWPDDNADAASCCPGLQEIQAGGQQIIDSGLLFIRTSLIAVGCAIQGLGKIMAGLGEMIPYHRA